MANRALAAVTAPGIDQASLYGCLLLASNEKSATQNPSGDDDLGIMLDRDFYD